MDSYATFEGTVLEVRRGYVRAVFSRSNSDKMDERGSRATWRFDRYSPKTTFQRQLKVEPLAPCLWSSREGCLISGFTWVLGDLASTLLSQYALHDSTHSSCIHTDQGDLNNACTLLCCRWPHL